MKLTNAKKTVSALALAVMVALTGIAASAQQGTQEGQQQEGQGRGWHRRDGKGRRGGGGGRGGFGHFGKLNLTDAQKAQIEEIATRFRESAKARREQMRAGRGGRASFDAFSGGTFNESAVRAAAQERANAQVEMEVARARMMFEVYNVLTAEQKAQLAVERQQREQKRQERRLRRQQANPATIQ